MLQRLSYIDLQYVPVPQFLDSCDILTVTSIRQHNNTKTISFHFYTL